MPGFVVCPPPKRTARGRNEDILVLLIHFTAENPFPTEKYEKILQKVLDSYYKTAGTVTSALREAASKLNEEVLSFNQEQREGPSLLAQVNFVVIRRGLLYLASAGPARFILLNRQDLQEFSDAEGSIRGLGGSRTTALKFFSSEVHADDLLVLLGTSAAPILANALSGSPQQSMEQLRRRLISEAGGSLFAGVVQFKEGKGEIHRLRVRSTAEVALESEPEPRVTSQQVPVAPVAPFELPEQEQTPAQESPAEELPIAELPTEEIPAAPLTEQKDTARLPILGHSLGGEPRIAEKQPAPPRPSLRERGEATRAEAQPTVDRWKARLARLLRAGRSARNKSKQAGQVLVGSMLPNQTNRPYSITPGAMLFIAIVVPFLVVAMALTFYFQRGQSQQHWVYLNQAQTFVTQAIGEKDAAHARTSWTQALYMVDQAEKYGKSDQSSALRLQAQNHLDHMDAIGRLDARPAFSPSFASNIQIVRMAANGTDVYLLDSAGTVHRIFQVGIGYDVDARFQCGPGQAGGGLVVGQLVDIISLPAGAPGNATLLALDGTGNLLYCIPGETPLSQALTPPDMYWGKITGFSLVRQLLYVFDQKNNSIYYYVGKDYGFGNPPNLYFDREIPRLDNVISLTSYGDDLYLLHNDGTMTKCTISASSENATRCDNKMPYGDSRPGKDVAPLHFTDANFTQMQAVTPFSLFILDTNQSSVYHFSLSLNLQQQLFPMQDSQYSLPNSAPTAFAVTDDRAISKRLFLAFGNQVYFSELP